MANNIDDAIDLLIREAEGTTEVAAMTQEEQEAAIRVAKWYGALIAEYGLEWLMQNFGGPENAARRKALGDIPSRGVALALLFDFGYSAPPLARQRCGRPPPFLPPSASRGFSTNSPLASFSTTLTTVIPLPGKR